MSRYEGWALSNNVSNVENGPRDLLRACGSQNTVSLVKKSVLGIVTTPDAPSLVVTFARYPTYPTVSPLVAIGNPRSTPNTLAVCNEFGG